MGTPAHVLVSLPRPQICSFPVCLGRLLLSLPVPARPTTTTTLPLLPSPPSSLSIPPPSLLSPRFPDSLCHSWHSRDACGERRRKRRRAVCRTPRIFARTTGPPRSNPGSPLRRRPPVSPGPGRRSLFIREFCPALAQLGGGSAFEGERQKFFSPARPAFLACLSRSVARRRQLKTAKEETRIERERERGI